VRGVRPAICYTMMVPTTSLSTPTDTAAARAQAPPSAPALLVGVTAGAGLGWGTGELAWVFAGLGAAVMVSALGSIRRARSR
jgi:hypothetical protein